MTTENHVNVERVQALIDVLSEATWEGLPEDFGFSMTHYGYKLEARGSCLKGFKSRRHRKPKDCGTVACIAGLTLHMFGEQDLNDIQSIYNTIAVCETAARMLGMDSVVANELFAPCNVGGWGKITIGHAIKALNNVIKYNDPKWDAIL